MNEIKNKLGMKSKEGLLNFFKKPKNMKIYY